MKIFDITSDSRKVKAGSIFVAIRGAKLNGEDFIESAIKNGATEIVVANSYSGKTYENVKFTKVDNPRKYVCTLARQMYPKQPQNVVAVTGTNGKTSTAYFFKQIAEYCGFNGASIGTLGVLAEGVMNDAEDVLTSPETVELHQILNDLAVRGVTHCAMETSSHGLSQHRADGVEIRAGAFTNLTRDHMDYHETIEDYFNSKARLFAELVKETAILNADVPEYSALFKICNDKGLKVLSYGKRGTAIKLIEQEDERIILDIMNTRYESELHLSGSFQVYNVMATIGLCIAIGLPVEKVIESIKYLKAAPGRLELVGSFKGAEVYVDYAHTPDALENAISSLKSHCKGKLHVLFGCGGDRDPGKRPQMGKLANDLADYVIVTDDNPRTEDPARIRKQIMEACPKALEYGDRAIAITEAMKRLDRDDMLLLAGKGHETYQVIGTQKIHFCDKEEVHKFLAVNNG